jgi:preprotein translocase subunit SecE
MEQVQEVRTEGVGGKVAAARGFLEGVQAELRKVTWPTRPELIKATRMVVIMSLILGVVIGLVDFVLQLILVRGVAAIAQ